MDKDKTINNRLGARLKHLRQHRKLSLSALAKASGLSSAGLCKIEKGQTTDPNISTIKALAKALGMCTEYFLSEGEGIEWGSDLYFVKDVFPNMSRKNRTLLITIAGALNEGATNG